MVVGKIIYLLWAQYVTAHSNYDGTYGHTKVVYVDVRDLPQRTVCRTSYL